ncbi:MAG: peptidylprolyl isomerase [Oscillospiraceae bacterium]|jgi:cyclophilin family peptidyl-prolyl cis-trans isomerase|nr:peptidylprolyl isomerase [Oscillospiraceae bacterium]
MKKLLSIIVSAALCVSIFAACKAKDGVLEVVELDISTSADVSFGGNTADTTIKIGEKYAAVKLKNIKNEIIIKLYPDYTPKAVENFTNFATKGVYKNKLFHRLMPNVSAEGGVLYKNGQIETNLPDFPIEHSEVMRNIYGAWGISNLGTSVENPTNSAQFYVVTNREENAFDNFKADEFLEITVSVLQMNQMYQQNAGNDEAQKYYADMYLWFSRIQAFANIADSEENGHIKELYNRIGGTPVYDGANTVFGQTVKGWEVLDFIRTHDLVNNGNGEVSAPKPAIVIENIYIRTNQGEV